MKCNFRPFISEPAENSSGNSNNSNNPVETQVHEEARDPDDEDEDEDEDEEDSTLPETEDNHGRDDILSKITGTTKRRCLSRIGCYLNSYPNNKPNGRRRELECFPNWTTAGPPTDRRIPVISPKSLRWLNPYGTAAERKSWIRLETLRSTLLLISTYSQEAIPIKSMG
jgi:hypothetical protein